jgi:hypothetical protein
MLSNVFKCFMLTLLPNKHERLTYTRTLPEIKDEMPKLKLSIFVENGNLFSYKFDQPCFSIFLLIFKECATCKRLYLT